MWRTTAKAGTTIAVGLHSTAQTNAAEAMPKCVSTFCRDAVDETSDLGILRETTTALCELGYNHTRWAVRSTVAGLLQTIRQREAAAAAVEGLAAAHEDAVRWTVTAFTLRSLHPHLRNHIAPYFED